MQHGTEFIFQMYKNNIHVYSQDFNSENLDKGREKNLSIENYGNIKTTCCITVSGMKYTKLETHLW